MGDVQWMTAGSGIIHQEMPKGDENGAMHGFQLWTNLPAASKMIRPRYQGFTAHEIPETRTSEGCLIKMIAGTACGITGPVTDILTSPLYCDCSLPKGATFRHETAEDHTALVYGIGGEGEIGETKIKKPSTRLPLPRQRVRGGGPGRPLSIPSHHRQTRGRARGVEGSHRHEYPGGTGSGLRRIPKRNPS